VDNFALTFARSEIRRVTW